MMLRGCLVRHRELIATPHDWPIHPFLPMVRVRGDQGLELGVMADPCFFQLRLPWCVFRANVLFMPWHRDELLELPKERFPSLEDLLAAGWRVD